MPEAYAVGGKSLARLALEVALIALGVFLGLMAEQWRVRSEHRELAESALRRFRAEIQANQKAVDAVAGYHATTLEAVQKYFAADAAMRKTVSVQMKGLQPVFFERTAWDLALATQSLAYIDRELAFSISQTYDVQQSYAELTRGMMQAMYVVPPRGNLDAFLGATETYFGDITLMEPKLLLIYKDLLPRIEQALGE